MKLDFLCANSVKSSANCITKIFRNPRKNKYKKSNSKTLNPRTIFILKNIKNKFLLDSIRKISSKINNLTYLHQKWSVWLLKQLSSGLNQTIWSIPSESIRLKSLLKPKNFKSNLNKLTSIKIPIKMSKIQVPIFIKAKDSIKKWNLKGNL